MDEHQVDDPETGNQKMSVVYAYDDAVTVDELFVLLERMVAHRGDRFPAENVFHVSLRDREKERVSLERTISVTARTGDCQLVGYLRILTDHAYMYYLLDVMVDPALRRSGIGKHLVELAVNTIKSKGFMKLFLTAIPGSEDFYKKFGFKESMSPVLTMRGEDHVRT